jgi:hypothetical protein
VLARSTDVPGHVQVLNNIGDDSSFRAALPTGSLGVERAAEFAIELIAWVLGTRRRA